MAVTNDKVQFGATLVNNLLSDPPIGSTGTATIGFDAAKTASDTYVAVSTKTAINSALTVSTAEYGLMRISNPNDVYITLEVDGATDLVIGRIPPGTSAAPASVLLPIGNGIVILATAETGTVSLGVTVVLVSENTA